MKILASVLIELTILDEAIKFLIQNILDVAKFAKVEKPQDTFQLTDPPKQQEPQKKESECCF
jgi:hypothetical protein